MEEILGLAPDAILGVYSGMTQDEYDTLAKIAPTVAYPAISLGTSWEATTRIIGQIMGKPAEADAIVQETIATVQAAGAQYPQLRGKSFAYGSPSDTGLYVDTTVDACVQLLSLPGMEPSAFVQRLPVGDDQSAFFVDVSAERLGELDADIAILWLGSQEQADQVAEMPTIQGTPAFRNSASAPIILETTVMEVSAPSPLSIPYIIETSVPDLAAGADKVPAV